MNNYEFKLTPGYCLYNGIAVMSQSGSSICFITENPENAALKERVKKAFDNYLSYVLKRPDCPDEFKLAPSVQFVEGDRVQLKKFVSRFYSELGREEVETADRASEATALTAPAAAVLLLDTLIMEARSKNATDIHIENNIVKFRVYGQLEVAEKLSVETCSELIQRIKFLAGMNVLERRRSQDGHFVYGNENPVFLRVSSVGVVGKNGEEAEESVVLRLLDTKRLPLLLEGLGFNQEQYIKIKNMNQNKNGLIVICGPTGAGKSTTAAALLLDIEKEHNGSVKILSLEDPPEYIIPGVTQIQIDEKINNSFANTLVHVFRQDPDVLMIGEIRDETSATVAVRAAITGHLVIATLHTSSAAGVLLRLENLGVSRSLIVSVLKGVIVQELNHFKGHVNLMADVCVPCEKLAGTIDKQLSEQELEACFEHQTNYAELFHKTIEILKEPDTAKRVEVPVHPVIRRRKKKSQKKVG